MEKVGYARISSSTQNIESQIYLLENEGCTKIFTDVMTGKNSDRPGWTQLLNYIREGDIIFVSELSRLTRSISDLLKIMDELKERKIELKSFRENIDTTSATGRAFVSIIGVISQMEVELKFERAQSGRISAKARGKTGGRPKTDQSKLEKAKILYLNSSVSASQISKEYGFSQRTLHRYIKETKKHA